MVEAATGTGKTALAFLAVEQLHQEHTTRLRVAIIVPTKILARQWRDEMTRNLGVPPSCIGELQSDAQVEWTPRNTVLIAVINSARNRLARILEGWHHGGCHNLLIVDECHRAGSEFNARIFEGKYDSALGLSATPERDDRGHIKHVYPGLGKPVYRYGLLSALDDGVLAPVKSINLYVDFDRSESAQWNRLSDEVSDAFRKVKWRHPWLQYVPPEELMKEIAKLAKEEDPSALHLQKALTDRRSLLAEATARLRCQKAALDWVASAEQRALVFHETIVAAETSARYLRHELGVRTSLDHSQLHPSERERAANDFRKDRTRVLVAVRALDEGVDVPDASVAIIGAGSRSRRQRIQRFGRVLRKVEGKEALVISILVRGTPEESAVGGADAALIGFDRVRHHRWPGRAIEDAVAARKSSYDPARPEYSVEDVLTMLELGIWDSKTMTAPAELRPGGGYSAQEGYFSPNGWHPVEDVRREIGVPPWDFDRLRQEVRLAFRLGLDPVRAKDDALIHGQEVEAIRRAWNKEEASVKRLGRRR